MSHQVYSYCIFSEEFLQSIYFLDGFFTTKVVVRLLNVMTPTGGLNNVVGLMILIKSSVFKMPALAVHCDEYTESWKSINSPNFPGNY